MADGLACESYLDTGNRSQFDNNAVVALHGQVDSQDGRTGCVPLATDAAWFGRSGTASPIVRPPAAMPVPTSS